MTAKSPIIYLKAFTVIIVLLVVVACSHDEYGISHKGISTRVVCFNAGLYPENNATKGLVPLDNTNLFTMGVFAGYEEEADNFGAMSPANDYIDNVRYTRSFIENPFAGADVCYWPFSGKLSFFAYSPFISRTFLQFSPDYVSGYPILCFTPAEDVSSQPDFCIADPVLNQHPTTAPIPLVFHHALSQVVFAANYSGVIPDIVSTSPLYVKVDNIRVSNVIGKKNVMMSNGSPCFEWQNDADCPGSDRVDYHLDRSIGRQISDVALPQATEPATDNYMDICTGNGRMYLIPQSMGYGDIFLEVTYGYYETLEGKEILRTSVTTSCPLPEVEWLPAHAYRYKFTINLASSSVVSPSVEVVLWNEVDNTGIDPIHIE